MQKILLTLLVVLGLALTGISAENTASNRLVDGNWFTIAADEGPGYGAAGDKVATELQVQIEAYEEAVQASTEANAKDETALASCETFAIRSWVKGQYALQMGLVALNRGDYEAAQGHYQRALSYGQKAQRAHAGRGEKVEGTSLEQGKIVVDIANRQLAKITRATKSTK
jgi:tetratricopeptide (TPR) repeat protein